MMPLICICWRYLYVNSGCMQLAGAERTHFSPQLSLIVQQRKSFGHFNQLPWSVVKSRVDIFYEKRRLTGKYGVYWQDLRSRLLLFNYQMLSEHRQSKSDSILNCEGIQYSTCPCCHSCMFGSNLPVWLKSLPVVCPRAECGILLGKTKDAFNHYVSPGFLPLKGKCITSVHRLGCWKENLLPPCLPRDLQKLGPVNHSSHGGFLCFSSQRSGEWFGGAASLYPY